MLPTISKTGPAVSIVGASCQRNALPGERLEPASACGYEVARLELEVEVRPGRVAGVADEPDRLRRPRAVAPAADAGLEVGQMAVRPRRARRAARMVKPIPHRPSTLPRVDDDAVVERIDRRALGSGDVGRGIVVVRVADRDDVRRRRPPGRRSRPVRGARRASAAPGREGGGPRARSAPSASVCSALLSCVAGRASTAAASRAGRPSGTRASAASSRSERSVAASARGVERAVPDARARARRRRAGRGAASAARLSSERPGAATWSRSSRTAPRAVLPVQPREAEHLVDVPLRVVVGEDRRARCRCDRPPRRGSAPPRKSRPAGSTGRRCRRRPRPCPSAATSRA